MPLLTLILSCTGLAVCVGWAFAPAAYGRAWVRLGDRFNRTPSRRPIPPHRSDLRLEIQAYLRSKEASL